MRLLRFVIITLVLAALVHVATIWALPRILMAVATTGMQVTGIEFNQFTHAERQGAESRFVVRPSPDMLYSMCLYDLSTGPLRISTGDMPDSYWSISGFAANTDVYFVINDTMMGSDPVDFLVGHEDRPSVEADYYSPSMRGMIIMRMIVTSDDVVPTLSAYRDNVVCGPAASGSGG